MFARLFAVASLAAFAVAGPAPLALRDQCNTGSINCCNSVQQANDVANVLSLFGIASVLDGVTGQVAMGCDPTALVGGSGAQCQQQPVCCTGNKFNGLINIGCSPINVNA
ncbi:fungal hydrophobin [Butyriboletus roseoflavus]|nr:fungal hydrophobin [Butyriboletus roseoflavus]